MVEFSLRDSLAETLRSLAVRAHQKELELTYRVRPQLADHYLGDSGRIRQVLIDVYKRQRSGSCCWEYWTRRP